jgi:cysteine desulfuration protein SufE
MNSDLVEKIKNLEQHFLALPDWESRYKEMIQIGKKLPVMPEDFKKEKFQIKGCQSQVWLYPEFNGSVVIFYADSDSQLVKGIISLLITIYSGLTPQEILSTKPDFLNTIGITDHLSLNRTNGLASMLKQIQLYARVYASMGG